MIISEKCCGCTACMNVCPVSAITMVNDKEGFLQPVVDDKTCIGCNLCKKVCQFNENKEKKNDIIPRVLGVKHKKLEVRLESRSGGFFTAISDYVLRNNGVIYGCKVDEKFNVVHARAINEEERDKFRGSKYVQSDLGNIYSKVKKDILDDKQVVFSGTPCQIEGLKLFLGTLKDRRNLLCVDIVCHGVPSPRIWRDYIKFNEKKYSKINEVNFRNKKDFGWAEHIETIKCEKKTINTKIFTRLFYKHQSLRKICYECPYTNIKHHSDITLADFWGIENINRDFNDNKGVSLVLINSKKGEEIFNKIYKEIDYFETDLKACKQRPFFRSVEIPKDREKFWEEYNKKGFEYIAKTYGENNIVRKVKDTIKKWR